MSEGLRATLQPPEIVREGGEGGEVDAALCEQLLVQRYLLGTPKCLGFGDRCVILPCHPLARIFALSIVTCGKLHVLHVSPHGKLILPCTVVPGMREN